MNHANLNLEHLRLFMALMETGALHRAATRQEMSQPAASRALAHLRETFGDKLFTKSGMGMVPTARAMALLPALREARDKLEAVLSPPRFDPRASERRFRLAVADNAFFVVVSPVIPEFLRQAPRAYLDVAPPGMAAVDDLRTGALDAAIVPQVELPPEFHRRKLFSAEFVCLMRKDHPLALATPEGKRPAMEEFARYRRLAIRFRWGAETLAMEKRALEPLNAGEPAIQTPYFLGVPHVLVDTDLVVVVPKPSAVRFMATLPLAIRPTPVPFTRFQPELVWHDRSQADPGMQWFRSLFCPARYA